MANYYVATDGSDGAAGTIGAPFATVNHALSVATAGDTIYLRAGTYDQRIYINGKTGTEFANINIANYTGETVIVRGDGSSDQCVLFNNSTWCIVTGLTIYWNESITPPDWKMAWVRFVSSTDCKIVSCTLPRNWVTTSGASRTLEQEYAAERAPGVQFGASCTRCGVDDCEIYGVNKGVQWNGISTQCYVINSYIHDTVQSNIDIALLLTGSTSRAGCLIEDNTLDGSYIEDNIQSHNSSVDTATTERGIIIRGNRIRRARENAIDLKNSGSVLVEDNEISGNWGSNNGSLASSGNNRNSLYSVFVGGSTPPSTHVIIRNNRIYDSGGSIGPLDYWMIYNNAFVANNRDYTGGESTYNDASDAFPKFLALSCIDNAIHVGFRNNLVANHNSSGILLRTATSNYSGDYNCFVGNESIGCVWASNAWPTKTLAEIQAFITAQGWTGGNESNSIELVSLAAAKFTNVPSRPDDTDTDLDWSYQEDSPLVDAGGHLTLANGAGVASTSLTVDDAHYFFDGFGGYGQTKDTIYIEGDGAHTITAIDYSTNVITLATAATWSDNAKIYLGEDDTPNIGLDNLAVSAGSSTITGGNTPAGIGRETAQLTSGAQVFEITGLTSLNDGPLAMTIITAATSESGVNSAPAMLSVGLGNATAQRSIQCLSKDSVNPSSDVRRASDTAIGQLQNTTNGTILSTLTLDSITSSAVNATWSVAPAAAYLVHNIVFNANASYVTDVALPTTVGGTVSITPGFLPDCFIVLGNSKAVPNTTGNADFMFSIGLGSSYNGRAQCCMTLRNTAGSPTNVHSRLTGSYIYQHLNTDGSISSGLELTSFGTTSVFTTRLLTPGSPNDVIIAALKFDVPMFTAVLPGASSNGNSTVSGTGVGAGLLMFVDSMLSALSATNDVSGTMSFGFATPDRTFATGYTIKHGATTSSTKSYSTNNVVLDTRQHDGTAGHTATLTSYTSDGFTLNNTDNASLPSRQYILWSIGGLGYTTICTAMPVGTVTQATTIKGAFSLTCTAMPVSTATQVGSVGIGGLLVQCTAMPVATVSQATVAKGAYSVTCDPFPVDTATNGSMTVAAVSAGSRVLHLKRRSTVLTLPQRIGGVGNIREIVESPIEMGPDERIIWAIDTGNWGGDPSNAVVTLKKRQRNHTWVDVTSTNMVQDDAIISTDTIGAPAIFDLTNNTVYRIEFQFDILDRTEEAFALIYVTENTNSIRTVVEAPLRQGENESIPYVIDATKWGGGSVYDVTVERRERNGSWTDVTDDVLADGDSTTIGDNVVLPALSGLTINRTYRMKVRLTTVQSIGPYSAIGIYELHSRQSVLIPILAEE